MPKARKSPLSKVTFAHELVDAVADAEQCAASTSPSKPSRQPTIKEASLAFLSTHVQQQVQEAVKELDEADLAEGALISTAAEDCNSFDLAERVYYANMRRWERAEDRKPPPDGLDQLKKYYKHLVKLLKAEVRMLAFSAAAFSAGCVARDAANKAQSVELHALRRLLVLDKNINRHKRKKVA